MAAAPSVRISESLKVEAASYAASIGVSLSALVAVALRDYLDRRRWPDGPAQGQAGAAPAAPAAAPVSVPHRVQPVPKVGANQPCPCGSRKPYKRCHGAG